MNPILFDYLKNLFQYTGFKAAVYFIVMTLGGLIHGVGILLLIPMLNMLLVKPPAAASHGITAFVNRVFELIHLPMTLPAILCVYILTVTLQSSLKRFQSVLSAEIIQGYSNFQHNSIYRSVSQANWLFISRKKLSDITHVLTLEIQRVTNYRHSR